MPTIKIHEINVSDDRQRTDVGDLGDLATSIKSRGLINPILLDSDNNLIAGFRRLSAHLLLGLDEIEYRRFDSLTDLDKQILELEENIQRKDLEWYEKAEAITKIHRMMKASSPDWNQDLTAAMLGYKDRAVVIRALQVVEGAASNEEIKGAKTLVGALNLVKRENSIKKRQEAVEAKISGKAPTFAAEILTGDSKDLIKTLPDESVDAIITNLPFGIDLSFKSGVTPYFDDEDYIVELVMNLCPEFYRVLRPDSWIVCLFDANKIRHNKYSARLAEAFKGIDQTNEVNARLAFDAKAAAGLTYWLEDSGFKVQSKIPEIWYKPNKTQGRCNDPDRDMIISYEAMIFARKGDPVLMQRGRSNVFVFDSPLFSERVHAVQQSDEFSTELVRLTCLGGSKVLDPFAGSGSVGIGALNRQCHFIGFELDPDLASKGNLRLREHIYSSPTEAAAAGD